MSYGYSQTNPAPPVSHHLKCYHKSQYQDDETATLQGTPVSKRVGHFVAKGVEKSKDQQSLVYGSGVSYATGKRADHRTSVNNVYNTFTLQKLMILLQFK